MEIKLPLEKLRSPMLWLSVALLAAMAKIGINHLDIGFLSLHSIDEYAFHGSLLKMYDGLREGSIQKFFTFGLYNYGFGFFLINLISTLPFLASDNTAASIFIPRLITSFYAVAGMVFIYRTAHRYTDARAATLIVVLATSMPAFWVNAVLFHPDWLMTACLIIALYYFVLNDEQPGKNYWYGVLWFSLATALGKFQALTFLPFLFFYELRAEIVRLDFGKFPAHLKRLFLSFCVVASLFILLNPYILHPKGLTAFLRTLDANLLSNATGHGQLVRYTVTDKISTAIFGSYINPVFFAAFLWILFYWCVDYFRNDRWRTFQALAFYCVIYLCYLLFFVNKDWPVYYLHLLMPAVLLFVPLIIRISQPKRIALLVIFILAQIYFYGNSYFDIATNSYGRDVNALAKQYTQQHNVSNFIVQSLKGKVSPTSNILISSYTGFAYNQLGLDYRNITIIWGPLGKEMLSKEGIKEKITDPFVVENRLSNFKTKDFIILRKDDVYFHPDKVAKYYDQAGYAEAFSIINKLDNNEIGYRRISENTDVIIYERTELSYE